MTMPPFLRAAAGPLKLMLQDRLAVIGLCVLSFIIAMALFAPALSTHDPRHINEIEDGSVLVRGPAGWELADSLGPLALNDADTRGQAGLIVGREGTLWSREGAEWRRVELPVAADLNAVAFGPEAGALIVGARGTILVAEGADWREIAAPAPANLLGVAWIDATSALIVGAGE